MGLLRLLLAISVVLFHANPEGYQFVGGGVAVEAFFIISGFYMSLILDTKYTGVNGGYALFISNRLLKLYPAYWTVLLLAVLMQLFFWFVTGSPILVFYHIVHFNMNWPGIAFLGFSNLAILGQDIVSFFGLNKATGDLFFTADFMKTYPFLFNFLVIPQGWSLGIELVFYLLAPLLLKRKWYVIALCMLASYLLRRYLVHSLHLSYDPWVFRFLPSQLLLFLAGNIAYRFYRFLKAKPPSYPLSLAIFVLLTGVTVLYSTIPELAGKKTGYLSLVFLAIPFLINLAKQIPFDNYLGELSYPVYLSHMLVLQTVSMTNSQTATLRSLPVTMLTIGITLLLSALINRYVVNPVNRFRQQRIRHTGS
ncbi:acyltransferase family protein [Sediminibacterium soli]|uniref:acyltransferase family protein n=1 Tax=Sediminibacterium soli TaxID=2698829 RepID=UPI001379609F|nr:acyltransferase [Sediminibacterium soli]NCI45289.1 acyltransferase [Sediminibacterium soli]